MNSTEEKKDKLNRRRALRIYEQVDIFYHKVIYEPTKAVDFNQVVDEKAALPLTQLSLDSYSQENATLNVNISATGISFTAKEKLLPGDYLMIRVLLLSSMTVIMTCCQVVYNKRSNPFEKKQYPYVVGAHFVNLKADDKALLDRHVQQKRLSQLVIKSLAISFMAVFLVMPDVILEGLIELLFFLLDHMLAVLHVLYEMVEYSLDSLIESVFHTELHDTQVIVFYIQVLLAGIGSYLLLRIIPSISKSLFYQIYQLYYRKKMSFFYYWRNKTLLSKVGLMSLIVAVVSCYGLFFI